jgi:hypothetical protein
MVILVMLKLSVGLAVAPNQMLESSGTQGRAMMQLDVRLPGGFPLGYFLI